MTMSRGGVRPPPVCADCSAPDPTWASVNRGVLICEECCSVHRSLGRHISIVKSLKKGQWSPSQHAMVYLLATSGANNIWEHTLLDPSQNRHSRRKPAPRDPVYPNKSDFIRAKYHFLSFINKQKDCESCSLDDVSKELHSSVRTNNVETCLRLLSKGADPNYLYKEKGNCPMHVAAHAGQTAQIELLAVYGADPGIKDLSGRTPVDYAKNEGFTDLAHRLVELQYELTDRLTFYICGRKPDHRSGQHFKIPQLGDHTADLSDLAKQAKKKLQDLPNHLFEELAMDVYDEVDRRENDSIWLSTHDHTSIVSERLTVPHLPVSRELSTTRNQGRQKLALFNAREFATLVMDILNEARLRQTDNIQMPKEPDKLTGLKLLKSSQSKTLSAVSDDEPLYDSVASDEDYSSIDSQSICSMQLQDLNHDVSMQIGGGGREVREGPMTEEEFLNIRRALAESQAKIQHLVQEKTHLEKNLTDMHNKVESLMMENQTLRIHRDSLMVETAAATASSTSSSSAPHARNGHPHSHYPHLPHPLHHQHPHLSQVSDVMVPFPHAGLVQPAPVRPGHSQAAGGRPTSMIEMRDGTRQFSHSSPVCSSQLSEASSASSISTTVARQEHMSPDLEDQLNANVLEVIDDLPPDAHLIEASDPPKYAYNPPRPVYNQSSSVLSQMYEPSRSAAAQGFHPPRIPGFEFPKIVPLAYDTARSDLPKASLALGHTPSLAMNCHDPAKAVCPQCNDPSGIILSQGYDPAVAMVSAGYDPNTVAVSQGYEASRAVASHGYDPPTVPPSVSQAYDTVRTVVSAGSDCQRGAASKGGDAQNAGFSQSQELARVAASPGYHAPQAAGSEPQPQAVSSSAHHPALIAQSFPASQAAVLPDYCPPFTMVPQDSMDQSQQVVCRDGNAHMSQPGLRAEGTRLTQSNNSPDMSVAQMDYDLPQPLPLPPPSSLVLEPPLPPTTTNHTANNDSDTGLTFGYDSASSGPQSQRFEVPPPVIVLEYDTSNMVLSQSCEIPVVDSQGDEPPSAVLPLGFESAAQEGSVPLAASVPLSQICGVTGTSPGFSPSCAAPAGLTDSVRESQAPDAQSSRRDFSVTEDQESASSQPSLVALVGGEGESVESVGGGEVVLPMSVVAMPTQAEVVRKTEKVTKKIQELLQSAQEGNHNSFAPCSEGIHMAVLDMAALFPETGLAGKVQETLDQLRESAEQLRKECCNWPLPTPSATAPDYLPTPPPDARLKTQQVIQFAFDIAKAAKKLVTHFQLP